MKQNEKINSTGYDIHIGTSSLGTLDEYLQQQCKDTQIAIICDENTHQHCLNILENNVSGIGSAEVIEIESGENFKNINTCTNIWETLTELQFNRNALIINLGGGVVCDLGGFVAGTYKRGIKFIHIPTTLLSQVDASVGGKCGIDFMNYKNQIGVFQMPEMVVVNPDFLKTLDPRQMISGYAEIIKHSLIADQAYWSALSSTDMLNPTKIASVIRRSIEIKNEIVQNDFKETGERKKLNFGHTIGHALESLSLENDEHPLFHGEAVAAGMAIEAYLSIQHARLSSEQCDEICAYLSSNFPFKTINASDYHYLIELMRSDKKNRGKEINFTLLNNIGQAEFNINCPVEDITAGFEFYNQLTSVTV